MNRKGKIMRFTASLLAVLTLAGSAYAWRAPESTGYPALPTDNVKARFVVGSDLHIGRNVDAETKLANAYSEFYTAAGNRLDAAAFVGDITNNGNADQYNTLMNIINSKTKSETQTILCMGNHEYYNDLSNEQSQALFAQKTGQQINKVVKVKGVYIITLGAPSSGGDYTSCYDFLKASLEAAVAEAPNAPIFVLAHHAVPNTAYVSDEWNGTYANADKSVDLEALMKRYPQVIHISGHSHATVEDARSISQDDGFTAIQDSTVSAYFENEKGTVSPSTGDAITCPEDCEVASQALMVEVGNDNIVTIRRMNLTTGKYIYEPWVINTPSVVSSTANFTYTNKRTGAAPTFAPDAAVSADNVNGTSLTVHFPAASPASGSNADMIHTYRITLVNAADTSKTTRSVFSDYYEPTGKDPWSVKINGLVPETTYSVSVEAVTSFNNASTPITMAGTVTTGAKTQVAPEQILDIDYSNGTVDDAKGHVLSKFGSGSIVSDQFSDSTRKTMRFNGDGGYGYALSNTDYEKINKCFTIEAYFKMDAVTGIDECVFSNQSGAGMGLEVEDGKLEFWCNLSVNGVKNNPKPSFAISANEWVHAVGTYDGTTLKLYKNGKEVYSQEYIGSLTQPDPRSFFVGSDVSGTTEPEYKMNGHINSVKLYCGARSASQVLADYESAVLASLPVVTQGQAYTLPDFFKNSISGLNIKTPNGNDVTVTDGAFTPNVPGKYAISGKQGSDTYTGTLLVSGVNASENTTWAPVNTSGFSALNDGGVHIAVSSDVHTGRSNYSYGGLTKLNTALKAYSRLAPDLSAYIFDGDSTDSGQVDQYRKLMSDLYSNADPKAKMIISMGNHEYYNGLSDTEAQARFLQMTDQSVLDRDTVVGGYHVITVAPRIGGYDHSYYAGEEEWILKTIDAAAMKEPNKPIFFATHQGFENTVQYTGGKSWDGQFSEGFYEKLRKYPQLVHFSGHTHIPLNDPRSIYQDGFTMVQTATLGNDFWMQGGEVASDGTKDGHPADGWDASQGLMLSVNPDTNVVTIYRIDLHNGKYIGTPWTLNIPAMVEDAKKGTDEAYLYTKAKRENNSVLPAVAEGAQMTVSGITPHSADIHVPFNKIAVTGGADPDDIVESYRVEVYGPDRNKDSETVYMADYYTAKQSDIFTRTIGSLQKKTKYTVKVYPRNAYQKEGACFSASFTTLFSDVTPAAAPKADFIDVDLSTGSAEDASGLQNKLNVKGQPKIESDDTLGRTVAVMDGTSAYGYDMDADKYSKITNTFSSEVLFRIDKTPATTGSYVELYSSGQSNGQNFEYYGDGKLYYYVSLNGSWVSVSAPVKTGAWTHAVSTYDGSKLKLYINGELSDTISLTGKLSAPKGNPQRYYLGADMDKNGEPEGAMTGCVALGRTYTRAISDGEVMGLFQQEQPVKITANASLPNGTAGSPYTVPEASAVNADGQSKTVSISVADPSGAPVSLMGSAFTPSVSGTYKITYKAGKSTVIRKLTVNNPPVTTDGNVVTPTPTPAAVDRGAGPITTKTSDNTTIASGKISGSVNGMGKTSGSLDSETASALVKAAEKAEKAGEKAVVEIRLESANSANTVDLSIGKSSFNSLSKGTDASLTLNTGIGSVSFNATAVDAINSAASGDIRFSIAKADTSGLSSAAKVQIGDRPVYDFTVTSGNSKVSDFDGGKVNISLPYVLKPGEDPNAVVVGYISNSGELKMVTCKYNEKTGMMEFTATHFSEYAVAYNKVSFSDVAGNAWYYKPITFIAARRITNGTTESTFGPDAALTRGQFIVMLMQAYGVSPDAIPTGNFSDAGNTYYTNYLAVAKRLGISAGVGSNMFAPDKAINRQEMFTLLYSALKSLGDLPAGTNGTELSAFGDANRIASWAKDAMTLFVKTGTIKGSNGRLSPEATTTRAEMAQVLYNMLSK